MNIMLKNDDHLNFRLEKKENESLYSFMYRNAVANFYENLGPIFHDDIDGTIYSFNYNYQNKWNEWKFKFFREFVQKDIHYNDFESLCLNQFDTMLFGKTPSRSEQGLYYVSNFARFCPKCLEEDFYYHLIWDVTFVTSCIKHNIHLIDKCPHCGMSFSIGHIMGNYCRCGNPLIDTNQVSLISRGTLETQSVIQNFLLGKERSIQISEDVHFSPENYFFLFRKIGAFIHFLPISCIIDSSEDKNFQWWRVKKDVQNINYITNVIHKIILAPNIYLPKVFEAIELKYESNRNKKFQIFAEVVQHPKGNFYKKVYSDYMNSKMANPNNLSIIPIRKDESKYISFSEAKILLNTTYYTLENLCSSNIFQIVEFKKEKVNKMRLLIREEVLDYKKNYSKYISLTQFGKLFGLGDVQRARLVEKGLLTVTKGKEVNPQSFIQNVSQYEINRFIEEIFGDRVVESASKLEINYMSFSKVIKKLKHLNIDSSELIKLIKNKTFSTVKSDSRNHFNNLYLLTREVINFENQERRDNILRRGYYRTCDILREFNVSENKFRGWIKKGILIPDKKQKKPNGSYYNYFSIEQIEELRKNYK